MNDTLVIAVIALPLIALWAGAIIEVIRRRDLGIGRSVAWIAALVIAPVFALAAYIVVRPERAVQSSRQGADTRAAETLVVAAEGRQRGTISDDEYAAAVRELSARPAPAVEARSRDR